MIVVTTNRISESSERLSERLGVPVAYGKIETLSSAQRERVEIVLSFGNYSDSLSEEALASLPNLRWIQVLSAGIDQLPLRWLQKNNTLLTTVQGIHAAPISEYVMTMVLHFAKRLPIYTSLQAKQAWDPSVMMGEAANKTIGILGTGSIGAAIAKKAQCFEMHTIGFNRTGRKVAGFNETYSLDQLTSQLHDCDYVCAALPSSNKTRRLFTKDVFLKLKESAVFMNVGRGDLIDEEALVEVINDKKIAGAALDVFEKEPLSKEHPFWKQPNIIVTPHASSRTNGYIPRALDLFEKNYEAFKNNDVSSFINNVQLDNE